MSEKVTPTPDRTWQFKQGLFGRLYRVGRTPAARWLGARLLAPPSPRLALAQGERLVRTPSRVLALTAHPDDLEFFAGGTLRRMASAGSEIHAVIFSDGEKRGNWTDLGERRRREQEEAARLQGYASVRFLGLPDFGLPEDPRLEHLVARSWDEVWPDVVFGFDPEELVPGFANRDHKALGRTVLDLARARLHTGAEVYLYGTHHADVLVELDEVMAEKVAAAMAHSTQMVYLDEAETRGVFELIAELYAGGSGVRWAEGLYRLL